MSNVAHRQIVHHILFLILRVPARTHRHSNSIWGGGCVVSVRGLGSPLLPFGRVWASCDPGVILFKRLLRFCGQVNTIGE